MAQERLQVILELISGQYKREAKQAAGATGSMTREMGKADKATGKLDGRLNNINKQFSMFKGLAAGAAVAAIGAFAKDAIRAATDVGESINAVEKTFGNASATILAFGQVSAQTAGLAKSEFQQMAAQTGQLLRGMGLSAQEAADWTVQLTTRAADMASVMNTDVATALGAIQSALRGETEPIRKFIGSFSVAEVEAYALEKGMLAAGESMDSTTKAMAAMSLIMDRTNNQAGDFVQTSDDLANASRIAAASWEDAKASFGEAGLPIATFFVQGAADALLNMRSKFDDAAYSAVLMRDAVRNVNDTLAQGGDQYSALADSLLHIAENGDLTADQFTALAAAAQLSTDDFGAFRDAVLAQAAAAGVSEEVIRELEDAMSDGGAAAEDAAGGFSTLGGEMNQIPKSGVNRFLEDQRLAFDRAAQAQEHWQEAQRGTAQLLREAADPAIAAAAAVGRYMDAQDDLAGVLEDSESSERDIAEAKLAVAEAALEAQAAVDEFSGDNVIRAASSLSDALGISTEEAYDLLDALGLLDGRTVTTYVDTIFRSQGNQGPTGRNTQIGGRAHGGPVRGGEMYRMGENNRPELMVIPGDNGRVFSNSDMKALIGAFQSGGSTSSSGEQHFHFHSTGDITGDVGTAALVAGISRRVEVARR